MVVLKELKKMFWGVTLDGGKRYFQIVKKSFHISMAALQIEPKQAKDGKGDSHKTVSVMIQLDASEFMLCTLDHKQKYQQFLDLNFTEGEEITFFLNGEGVVHLSGYILEDFDPNLTDRGDDACSFDSDYSDEDDDDDDETDDDEENSYFDDIPKLQSITAGRSDSEDSDEDEVFKPKASKRKIISESTGKQMKKQKFSPIDNDEDDDDEDDDDYDSDDMDEFDSDDLDFLDDEAEESDGDEESEEESDEEEVKLKKSVSKKDKKTPQKSEKTPKITSNLKKTEISSSQTPKTPLDKKEPFHTDSVKKSKKKKKKNEQKETPKTPSSTNSSSQKTPNTPTAIQKKTPSSNKITETPKTTPDQQQSLSESSKKSKKKKKQKNKELQQNGDTPQSSAKNRDTPQSSAKSRDTPQSSAKNVNTPQTGQKKVRAGGTTIVETKVGSGPEAKPGKMVHVYYRGCLENGKQFDACGKGKPFAFRLGKGEVIKGWDTGVIGMKVGGKRKVTVPAAQGYGSNRQGPIPPNSTLVFDIELKAIT